MKNTRTVNLEKNEDSYSLKFNAMASPCEVIIQTSNEELAVKLGKLVSAEVWRIEDKYSRYDNRSLCCDINSKAGQSIAIDEETFQLLSFADQCYQLSEGLFDITSGVLRKIWSFNSQTESRSNFPTAAQVNETMLNVGWDKVNFDPKQITLAEGMEIDFGGIGKEYAVDRGIIVAKELTNQPVLVNLGGDLAVTGARLNNETWQVAIEPPDIDSDHTNDYEKTIDMIVSLKAGALATGGDSKRFLINKGKRYGHILNAKTGWPISKAPRSITVVAPQCIQAGILATFALLQGCDAEEFLTNQEIKFWARR
ncbi:FAD:protein FMN transferase [Colwellia sp. MSW7]|uniref:FAD:protein FMN transferase n=1 Tax=Colwellia maritima TaxID=2912588 RepID=A0ABS9X3W1_9GAMM|nr:FAD:protein FMN transferase [Colwellia maritima]MCI2284156.1 FAD:protein FMN transferase [Colwellia maritima]